jgi:arylsulfatase A-like enzyme
VDLAPTFLGLAGLPQPEAMDGHSLAPLLMPAAADEANGAGGSAPPPGSVRVHLQALAPRGSRQYAADWRRAVFIER